MRSRFVEIDEMVLEDLILEAARAPPEPRELDFKPNTNLGEGEASPEELKYREELLACMERAFKAWDKVLAGEGSIDDKLEQLDPIIDRYIGELQDVATEHVTKRFLDSVRAMNLKLRALGVKRTPKPSKNMNRLTVLLRQQLTGAEASGLRLKLKLKGQLTTDSSLDLYGGQ